MVLKRTYIGSPDNPKTAAIVCYITFIGWLIAYFALYQNNKTSLVAYHLRQTLLLYIISFAVNIFLRFAYWPYNGFFVWYGLPGIFLFILWLIGLIAAANGREKPIPLIGSLAQKWFHSI